MERGRKTKQEDKRETAVDKEGVPRSEMSQVLVSTGVDLSVARIAANLPGRVAIRPGVLGASSSKRHLLPLRVGKLPATDGRGSWYGVASW